MVPLEVVFIFLLLLWGLIGFIRGFSREGGSTIAIVLAMTVLLLFAPRIIDFINKAGRALGSSTAPMIADPPSSTRFWFYVLVFAAIVFMGYQGQTFFLGNPLSRSQEPILGLAAGLVNGYLVAGSLWWFLTKLAGYTALGLNITAPTTQSAQQIIHFLPFDVLGGARIVALLLLLLVLRIAR